MSRELHKQTLRFHSVWTYQTFVYFFQLNFHTLLVNFMALMVQIRTFKFALRSNFIKKSQIKAQNRTAKKSARNAIWDKKRQCQTVCSSKQNTFRKRITEPKLKSSKNPQIRTTMSVMVGSQTPLLQNPVLQGVPSGSISSGCITKQEVFKFCKIKYCITIS